MSLHIPEIDPDGGAIAAALGYADAGWCVLPVDPGTKHPGSVVGKGWPAKSSRDKDQIVDWFMFDDHALALHVGRSGAVALDVDDPTALPPVLIEALGTTTAPHQSTRADAPGRGHYLFTAPDGRTIGNSAAGLGDGWGDVRGKNGIIVVSPSVHAKAADGGRYTWLRTGALPPLPGTVAELLRDASDSADAATDPEITAFLRTHTGAARPSLLKAVTARFTASVDAGRSRHESMLLPAANAMREARAGFYPAHAAAEALQALFVDALARSRGADRVLTPQAARAEFSGILAWAIAQAAAAPDTEMAAVADGIADRAPDRTQLVGDLIPPPDPFAEMDTADGDSMATVHTLTTGSDTTGDGEQRTSWWPRNLAGVLSGIEEEPPPSLLARADGVHLWYAAKVNGLLGESESGKTWVGLLGVAQALAAGHTVAYFDFEDTPAGIVSRLRAMGVADDHFTRLDYIGPDEALHLGARGDVADYLTERRPALAVVDGVNAAMTLMGLDLNSNTDATRFTHALLKPLTAHGAAVVAIDHVPKSKEGRGKGGIGAQAKRAMMTGCAITVDVAEPFGRGMTGRLRLYVDKDRPGYVRAKSAEAKYAGTAVLESDAVTGAVGVTIRAPQDMQAPAGAESGPPARTRRLMEAVSLYLSDNPERSSMRGIRDSVKGRPADVGEAVEALVRSGHVVRSGSGNRFTHVLVRPYSTLEDLIITPESSTESENGVVPGGSRPVSVTESEISGERSNENGQTTHSGSGSVVPKWFPPVPGTTSPDPDASGSPVPTPLGGNREPLRPGAPEHTPDPANPRNHPSAPIGAANRADRIVVIDGRIITTDGAILERHGDDLIDTDTKEIRGHRSDLPAGAA